MLGGLCRWSTWRRRRGRVRVDAPGRWPRLLAVAGSVAVNGCCLTVVDDCRRRLRRRPFVRDTAARTGFAALKHDALGNLERPLTAGKELGGHFVQGHVDGVGRVTRLAAEGANWWLGVRVPEELERYVAMKGSIAIDGISLTVASLRGDVVEVAIIPFTYANTNLRGLITGTVVNLEADILAKYIERLSEARKPEGAAGSRLTVGRLIEEGILESVDFRMLGGSTIV